MDQEYLLPQVASEVAKAINKALSSVQTVNGTAPDANGNVEIKVPEGGGTVTDEQIAQAVDEALEQARESGEFDGAPGADGRGIASIVRTSGNGAAGTVDTYAITYTDGTTGTYQVRNGADGAKGDKGDKGDPGVQGIQGPAGATGATGPKGDTGATGATGAKGADGYTPVRGTDYWTPADQEDIVQQVIAALGTPVFGRVDGENNIILSGELADGTYTLKWLNADGSYTDAGTVTVGKIVTEPTNLFVVGGDGYIESGRCSSKGENRTDATSSFVTNYIDVSYGDVVRIKGYQTPTASGAFCGVKYADGTTGGFMLETDEVVVKDFSLVNGIAQFTVNAQNADFMRFTILKPGSLDDIVITVNEPLE